MLKKRFVVLTTYSEIFILALSIAAFGFIIGEVSLVSSFGPNYYYASKYGIFSSVPSVAPVATQTDSGTFGYLGRSVKDITSTAGEAEKAGTTGTGGPFDLVNDIYGGTLTGGPLGPLIASVAWAGTVYLAVKFLAPLFGADEKTANALALAGAAGSGAGSLTYFIVRDLPFFGAKEGVAGKTILGSASETGFIIGVGIAAVVFVMLYKKESNKIVELQCLPWEAPLGGRRKQRKQLKTMPEFVEAPTADGFVLVRPERINTTQQSLLPLEHLNAVATI